MTKDITSLPHQKTYRKPSTPTQNMNNILKHLKYYTISKIGIAFSVNTVYYIKGISTLTKRVLMQIKSINIFLIT